MRALFVVALLALSGCQTVNQRCDYYKDGTLEHYRLRSSVVGTGETEVITTDCGELASSTQDTGISDNGVNALGMVAKGVAAGVIRSLIP
jgi:hypothetical protein